MSRALFTAVSGLKTHQTKMDVIGNNIANVSTYGFKTARTAFRDVFYQNMGSGGGSNAAIGGLGGQNPYQIGYGTMVSSIDTNQAKTGFASTGYASDCYVNGDGFFVVGTLNGAADDGDGAIGQIYYTRVGMFDFDSAGYLVDSTGQLVCGVQAGQEDTDETGQEALRAIFYNPAELEGQGILPIKNITIGSDGVITCIGTDGITYGLAYDGDGDVGGLVRLSGEGLDTAEDIAEAKTRCIAIALADISNPAGMEMVGNSYYTTTGNSGQVNFYQAGTHNLGSLKTSGLEMSGTDISQEFAEMIMTQRGFQANSRIVSVVDSMLEEVVNMKR